MNTFQVMRYTPRPDKSHVGAAPSGEKKLSQSHREAKSFKYCKTNPMLRIFAAILIPLHLLSSVPISVFASSTSSNLDPATSNSSPSHPDPVLTPKGVKAIKVPIVKRDKPVIHTPQFSSSPTDAEMFAAQIFEEPLVPTGAKSNLTSENRELTTALLKYFNAPSDLSPITSFIQSHPDSRWNGALLADLGIVYRKTGRFSKAQDAWQKAWAFLKDEKGTPEIRALAGRVISEIAEFNAWVGRANALELCLKESEQTLLLGKAAEKISSARVGLGFMKAQPGDAFKCGPLALTQIKRVADLSNLIDPKLMAAQSTDHGLSLNDVRNIALASGMKYQMAKRDHGSKFIYPCVVHWKLDHYGTLLKEEEGRVFVQDSTFDSFYGQTLWIDKSVIDEEASGYFLVPEGSLPTGWKSVSAEEGKTVWGKGAPGGPNTNDTGTCCNRVPPCPKPKCQGMPQFDFQTMVCGVSVFDNPIGYTPPRGVPMDLTVIYNSREASHPANLNFSNFGPNWNYDWLSYVQCDYTNQSADATVCKPGGGTSSYTGYTGVNPYSLPQRDSRDVLYKEVNYVGGASFILYRTDGVTVHYFDVFGTGVDRKVMLSSMVDFAGNETDFFYDAQGRLDHIVDPLGQVTQLYYEDTHHTFFITKVRDPFYRTAVFTYDAFTSQGIGSITDEVGLTSSFVYQGSNWDQSGPLLRYMNVMKTPYGSTLFVLTENGTYRSVKSIDPLGEKQRLDTQYGSGLVIPDDSIPGNPAGMDTSGAHLTDAGNSFFWDKKAMADGSEGDLTKARATHWIFENHDVVSGMPFYTKAPFEKRVWYNYPGQPVGSGWVGTNGLASAVGRVLDDGVTTQLEKFEYNAFGMKTKITDPLGRQISTTYATVNPLDITQTRNGANELLAHFDYGNINSGKVPFVVMPNSITDASGQKTSFAYNTYGQLTSTTNALSQVTSYNYDSNAYLQTVTGPLPGATIGFTRDSFGRIRTITDSEGYVLTYDYDNLDRVTKITHPDNSYEQFVYNKLDLVQSRDRKGRWTEFLYDLDRHLVGVRDPAGRLTQYEWCDCGSLAKIIDPNGNATTWFRDVQSRITSKAYADGKSETYNYENTTSRLLNVIDAKGQKTQYTYNVDNSVKQIDYLNAVIATHSVAFTYDPNYPRATTMVDGNGTTTYAYNPITGTLGSGHLASVDGPWSNDTISYNYDELGRAKTRTINTLSQTAAFDSLGRATNVVNSLGNFKYNYVNTTARLSDVTYPNGQKTTFDYYDNLGDQRLKTIQNLTPGSSILSSFQYQYDVVGQITKWTLQADAQSPNTYEFQYDAVDQLTSAVLKNSVGAFVKSYAYGYDKAGNRTSEQIDNAVTKGTFNNVNQLTADSATGGPVAVRGHLNEPGTATVNGQSASVDGNNNYTTSLNLPQGNSVLTVNAQDYSGNGSTKTFNVNVAPGKTRTLTFDNNGNPTKVVEGTSTTTLK
jgi:YD repeat-containing protein